MIVDKTWRFNQSNFGVRERKYGPRPVARHLALATPAPKLRFISHNISIVFDFGNHNAHPLVNKTHLQFAQINSTFNQRQKPFQS